MSDCGVGCVASVILVGFVWGATNPLLRAASVAREKKETEEASDSKSFSNIIAKFLASFFDWRFSVPFLVNQSASVLFNILVVNLPVTIVVPCVNAIQFLSTAIVGHLMGEKLTSATSSKQQIAGLFLTVFAIFGMLIIDS